MEMKTDYRDYIGRISPTELYDQDGDMYGVIITAMPDDKYSVHLGDHTLYYDIPKMPDEFRINLLLTKARYSSDMTETVHKTISYEFFRDILTRLSIHRNTYKEREFRPIGFMLKPGIYLITVQYDQIKKYYEKEKDHE